MYIYRISAEFTVTASWPSQAPMRPVNWTLRVCLICQRCPFASAGQEDNGPLPLLYGKTFTLARERDWATERENRERERPLAERAKRSALAWRRASISETRLNGKHFYFGFYFATDSVSCVFWEQYSCFVRFVLSLCECVWECVCVCVCVGLSLRSQQPHACAFETQLKRFTASTCG